MSKQSEGDKMLADLEKLCTVVCKNTSEHGCEILLHEMKELSDSWSQYNTALMESKCNLTNVIQQWTSFEKNIQSLNKWFKDMDAEFKKPQLQSTLEEKETQHAILKVILFSTTARISFLIIADHLTYSLLSVYKVYK